MDTIAIIQPTVAPYVNSKNKTKDAQVVNGGKDGS